MNLLTRLLALLAGLAATAAGVIVVVETVLLVLGRHAWVIPRRSWDSGLRALTWAHPALGDVLTAFLGAGALLLLLALWPRRPRTFPLIRATPHRRADIDASGLAARLARTARTDIDVLHARVRIRRRAARVTALAPRDADRDAVRFRLRRELRETLNRTGLRRTLRTRVSVREARERVR